MAKVSLILCYLILALTHIRQGYAWKSDNKLKLEYKELEDLVHALEDAIGETKQKDIQEKFASTKNSEASERRGLKETLLKKMSGLKATYKSKSFLPQTPADFIRYGSIGAEIANSPTGGATFGVFTGAATCVNIFCSPLSLLHLIILGLSTVEDMIVGTGEAIETANDDVLKNMNSVPWVGSATKVVSKFLDNSVEPVMGTLETKTKAVTTPIGFAYNTTLAITNMCIDFKTLMMSVNLLAWIKDLENDNKAYRDDLMILSDYLKGECGAILDKLPTIGNIILKLKNAGMDLADDIDGEALINAVAKESKLASSPFNVQAKRENQINMRSLPSGPNALADHDPITIKLKEIVKAVNAAKNQMKVFEPIIDFFDIIRSVIDKVLDFELRIPIGPYGPLLGAALQIGEELVSGMVDAVDRLKSGDVVGAGQEMIDTVGNVGDIANQQIEQVAGLAEDAAEEVYDGLKSAGTDVANWMNGAGNEIKDGLNSVGDTLSNAWESGTSAIGSVFSGWKKRKRALQSQFELEGQSPNYHYYRSLNVSLVRSSRGFNPSSITKLGNYICGFFICVTPREVLDFGRDLIDTILKPFEIIITAALKPVLDELKDMFSSVFPNMDFLDDISSLSITMLPVSDFTKLINVFKTNDLFAYIAASAPSALGAECIKFIKGYVNIEPEYNAGQVKCACVDKGSNCGSRKKRTPDGGTEKRAEVSHPDNCRYTGKPYQGKLAKTKSGKTCTAWQDHSHSGSSFPEKSAKAAKTFCRNPDGKKSPWCYTGSHSHEWEYCSVPLCRTACMKSGTTETDGKWSITGMRKKCQPWEAKLPHDISFPDSQFPEKSVSKAEDYCHNPTGDKFGPYCLTTTYGISMDVCDIPYCDGTSESMTGFKEYLDHDCPNNDVKHMTAIHLYECLKECKRLANCHAVGHNPSEKKCWLKSQCDRVNNWSHTTSMNAYIKSDAPEYTEFVNRKCGGNDILPRANVDSVRECKELCDLEPRCIAFEYSGTHCFIKYTCNVNGDASGVRTFVQEAKDYAKYSDRDCPYHDIRYDSGVYSPGQCQARCNSLPNCGAFTLDHHNGNCYLKKRCRETEMKLKDHHDTYILKYAPDYDRHMLKDCPGNDIKWMSIDSPRQCAGECLRDTLCVAFGVVAHNCWLKHTCNPATLVSSNIDIHLKKDVMYFHRSDKKDCVGNDITAIDVSLDKCATSCRKHFLCKAFHFLPRSALKGTCWLKSKCETHTDSGGNKFVLKESIGYERYRDRDCYGNDISHTTRNSPDDCAKECRKDSKCYGFLYKASQSYCWLKSKCKISDFKTVNGLDAYLETDIQGFQLYKNKDCLGHEIDEINVNGIKECASLCFKMSQCVAFGLRLGDFQCWLKRRCVTSEFLDVSSMYTYILQDTSRPHVVEVAQGRPTAQSTIYNKGFSKNAVDGKTGWHYDKDGASETAAQSDPWWSVTLDSVLKVHYVTIVNRGDCCSERLHDFDVLLTSDTTNPGLSTHTKRCKHRAGVVASKATDTVKCDTPTVGKNLIIRILGHDQILTLAEVKVYASTPIYKTACEDSKLTVQCPVGDYVQIVSAMYGRTVDKKKCPATFHVGYSTSCTGSANTLQTVRRACDGYNKCTVNAANKVFGDPCLGNWKYLEVSYNCVNKYQTICEGSTMTLQCPSGKTIEMISANFGRKNTEAVLCKYPGPGNAVTNDNCYASNSLSVVAESCEGKNSCSVLAATSVFGEPCANTYKYLEVAYNCSE